MAILTGSVGAGGINRRGDVKLVQMLRNDWLGRTRETLLTVDGLAGPLTNGAIRRFQTAMRLAHIDGRVDPGRATITALANAHRQSLEAGVANATPQPGRGGSPTATGATFDKAFEGT